MAKWLLVGMLVTVGIYAQTAWMPFIYEDANWTSELRPEAQQVGWWAIPSRALTMQTLVWNYQAESVNPRGYHLVNVLLHLVVGLLVWRLTLAWTADPMASVAAAVIMWWHPLNTQAVSYVSARTDLLLALCVLTAALGSVTRWWLMPAAVLGALVSKEAGVVVVPIVWWAWVARRGWSWRMFVATMVGALGVIYGARRYLPALNWSEGAWDHVTIQATGLWRGFGLFLWPVGLSVDPDPWSVPAFWRVLAVLGVLALVAVAVAARTRQPLMALCLGAVVLSVAHRFVVVAEGEPLHEHHLYVATAFMSVCAGALVSRLMPRDMATVT